MCQICLCYLNVYYNNYQPIISYLIFYIGYWNFENTLSINRLFVVSAQHYYVCTYIYIYTYNSVYSKSDDHQVLIPYCFVRQLFNG